MKKTAVAAVAAFSALSAAFAAVPAKDTLISHRGESIDAPENTLPAYKTAVERGFGFECDVYLSADGRVFTFHDRDLKRTTDGACTKSCAEATWEEVAKADVGNWGKWKGSKFKGTRPALLEEVLELARDGRWIYVEVKPGPEIVPFIKDVFAKQKNATPRNALFIAFNRETCKALKAQMPEYRVYWLTSSRVRKDGAWSKITPEYVIEGIRETGADGVDCHYSPDVIDATFVKKIRDAGYDFHVWTVDAFDNAVEAFARGAQTVTTNCAKRQLDLWETACGLMRGACGKKCRPCGKKCKPCKCEPCKCDPCKCGSCGCKK